MQDGALPIFDGHNDVLLALYGGQRASDRRSFFERGKTGHLDLPRAREGGFAGGFFAVYVTADPASRRPSLRTAPSEEEEWSVLPPPVDQPFALRLAMSLTATLFRLEEESGGELQVVRDAAALRRCLDAGTIAAILHFEGAEAIDPQLNALEVFYRAGLRSLGLVWSRPNAFAEGVPFRFPSSPDTGPGLTAAGRELVRACNRMGILLDLSHLNERGFWDVAELSDAPLVATHSNAHAVTPCTRNLTDAQLDAVRDSGGVVGVNFAVSFSREDGKHDADTPLDALVRHFSYLCERMGADHVAFGSDFDGTTVPTELGDAAGLPRLVEALRRAGFGESDLRKLGTENWVRVLERTWK
ncbi:MAG TPA: dipeptidase [Candidatus Dormibacteraeota bacterium]|nr:dipeptidase [Candidatus Dormibacteraeota bacterium]